MSTQKQNHKQTIQSIEDHNPKNFPFKHAYGPRHRMAINFQGPGKTKQSFKDECDINVIMKRYAATGILPDYFNPMQPQYLDVTGYDFDKAMHLVAEASSMFHELPSHVRDRFKNDPGAFLDFCSNPENRQELAEMGLLKAESLRPMVERGAEQKPPKEAKNPVSGDSANISENA